MISKVSKVFDYSAIASGIVLFLLAVLTFCDVFGRRFLNSPVTGTIELVEIGMALVAFLAMPRAFYLNANVSADFINNLNLGIFKTYLVILKFVLMIRRPPRSTLSSSSAASDVYKRQVLDMQSQELY